MMSVPYSDCVINQSHQLKDLKVVNNRRSSNIKNYEWSVTEPEVMGHVTDNVDEFIS